MMNSATQAYRVPLLHLLDEQFCGACPTSAEMRVSRPNGQSTGAVERAREHLVAAALPTGSG
jgi:hypothetical protein